MRVTAMLFFELVALFGLFISPAVGSPVTLQAKGDDIHDCHDIITTEDVEAIAEPILKGVAMVKLEHDRSVRYCPGNSTLFHQIVGGDDYMIDSIGPFRSPDSLEARTTRRGDEDDYGDDYNYPYSDEEGEEVTDVEDLSLSSAGPFPSSSPASPLLAKRQRYVTVDSFDCSILCGEPNTVDCAAIHRDRYYGWVWRDLPQTLQPNEAWVQRFGGCWFLVRNLPDFGIARVFSADGHLQVTEGLYNSCVYFNQVGGGYTGMVPGWRAYVGHPNQVGNTHGATQCVNSIEWMRKMKMKKKREIMKEKEEEQLSNTSDKEVINHRSPPNPVSARDADVHNLTTATTTDNKNNTDSVTVRNEGEVTTTWTFEDKEEIIEGEITPEMSRIFRELAAAFDHHNNNNNNTNSNTLNQTTQHDLSKRQQERWNKANLDPGTMGVRLDCGEVNPNEVSGFIYDRMVYGGNQNIEHIVQPQTWYGRVRGSTAFVTFNADPCCALGLDFVHNLHNMALLAFDNVLNRRTTHFYGSSARGYDTNVYQAFIRTDRIRGAGYDRDRVMRCVGRL